ncbi:MAG: dienelactone hydrolase family protein [Trebonia sp.]
MNPSYAHLGGYSDWPVAIGFDGHARRPDRAVVRRLASEVLTPPKLSQAPADVRVERRWTADGLDGEEISYDVGYGPRPYAWVLKPAAADGPLPGVLALHDHGDFKYYGKEKIADGPEPAPPVVTAFRDNYYEGRVIANDLARAGYVVLVPDVFGWGSRRFPLPEMPPLIQRLSELTVATTSPDAVPGTVPSEIARYNAAAWHHEHLIEKYCAVLGTTLAATVAHEDRLALSYLRSRPDTTDRTASIGLSGGGARSALLRATSTELTAAVVVGMMGTYGSLLDHNVIDHTWMLFPPGLTARADWPDLAACQAPAPLLVQYDRDDELFTLAGAQAAHDRITAHYADTSVPDAYTGRFYDGPHKFDQEMQRDTFSWLTTQLRT